MDLRLDGLDMDASSSKPPSLTGVGERALSSLDGRAFSLCDLIEIEKEIKGNPININSKKRCKRGQNYPSDEAKSR